MSLLQDFQDSVAMYAVSIRAWQVMPEEQGNRRHEALPVDLPKWVDDSTTAALLATNCLLHKGAIIVLYSDAAQRPERRNVLSVYTVKRRTNRRYVRDGDGKSVREPEHYPELQTRLCVADGFSPIEPANVMANPVGLDRTLVTP